MILNQRFYIALSLIILLLGSGYTFAPLFVLGQGILFVMLLAVLVEGYMLYIFFIILQKMNLKHSPFMYLNISLGH